MSAHTSTPPCSSRAANGLRRRGLAALAVGIVATSALLVAAPAHAVDPQRQNLPVVAGSVLQMPNGLDCTAGLVLRSTSFVNRLTDSRRNTRYVLTAGHCAPLNASVSVGGIPIGNVIWKSSTADLELIIVPPRISHYRRCDASSLGVHCYIYNLSDARALGRVILPNLRTRTITGVPVTGAGGTPPEDEEFCTSAKVSGVACGWSNAPIPGGIEPRTGERGAESLNTVLQPGDSGGPVTSADGHVYGIISRGLGTVSSMLYVSTDEFFTEQTSYAIAPA